MPVIINGTTGITTPTYNGNVAAEYLVPVTSLKNRLINSAMVIDQRNAGASVAVGTGSTYVLDRWVNFRDTSGGAYTVQQNAGSVTPPAGFTNYLGITVTTTDAFSSAGTQFNLTQFIEGFNAADLDFGKSTAKSITLSFWVLSSLTGTFAGGISNSAGDRSYVFTYTINSANTWEQKSVTIAGDTSGTWLTTNGIGIRTIFSLGTGATYQGTAGVWAGSYVYNTSAAVKLLSTGGATFYITGVQLEVGTTATSFEYRQYTTELQLCQRYLPAYRNTAQDILPSQIQFNSTTNSRGFISFPVPTRVPVTSMVVSSAGHFTAFGFAGGNSTLSSFTMHAGGTMSAGIDAAITGTFTTRDCATIGITNSAGFVYFNGAEL
jgi:hypothetical protein